MFKIQRILFNQRRFFSTPPQAPVTAPVKVGSTLSQRLGSFFVGLGVGFGVSFYMLHEVIYIFNIRLLN